MFKKKKKDENIIDVEVDENEYNESSNITELESKKKKKKNFSLFNLIFDVIVGALLIAFGVLLLVKQDESVFIIFIVTAAAALIVVFVRLFFILIKKEKDSNVKKVLIILSIIHGIIGIYLIIAGIVYNNDLSSDSKRLSEFSKFNNSYYPIFLAVLLYSEAVAYFMNTVLFKKISKKFAFWLHIAIMTFAVIILALASSEKKGEVTGTKIVVTIAIISFVCAVLSIVFAIVNYNKHRGGNEDTVIDVKEDASVEENEEENSIHLPDENNDDQPIVM